MSSIYDSPIPTIRDNNNPPDRPSRPRLTRKYLDIKPKRLFPVFEAENRNVNEEEKNEENHLHGTENNYSFSLLYSNEEHNHFLNNYFNNK